MRHRNHQHRQHHAHPHRRRLSAFLLATAAVATLPASLAAACSAPPPAVTNLSLERFYTDAKGSRVDHAIRKANDLTTKPVTDFLRATTAMADNALRSRDPVRASEHATCALTWMQNWAEGRALTGAMTAPGGELSKQGEHHRKWTLAGLALTYLKLKPFTTAGHRAAIEPWLKAMADDARALFDDAGVKRNNHWYWLGLGTGAVGLATGSEPHWKTAAAIFQDAMGDVSPDGTLPMELARGSQALSYHAFAVTPLVVLAELAASRGEDWYVLSDSALHRLVATTAKGLAQPEGFAALSGSAQKEPVKPGYGWLNLYAARFPGRLTEPRSGVKPGYRRLGGDTRLLKQALSNLHR